MTYLDRIVQAHRAEAATDRRDRSELHRQAASQAEPRGFRDALLAASGLSVIAEIKRRSPSRGALVPDLDPASMARAYEDGGATCLSVLTDERFFGGSESDLRSARAACQLPVLRKDFTVAERDVYDARIMGADCILLIVAALEDPEMATIADLARELKLDVLVEVHDERDLERATSIGADLIGVNQRDLVTFEVDRERALSMAELLPAGAVRVAESGIEGPEDAAELASAGYDAVLVGESLVRSEDPASAVAALRAADRRDR